MSIIEKALSFIKKTWKSGDTVLPDDLNRYENGIEDLYINKINTSNIANNLTTDDAKMILAAPQGKILDDKIKVLSEGKLDKVIVKPSGTHVNTCCETGIYKCVAWNGYPSGIPDGQGTLNVTQYGGDCLIGWVEHEFITPHENKRYIGAYVGGNWSGWSNYDDKINDLSINRGYVTSKRPPLEMMNKAKPNGIYTFWDAYSPSPYAYCNILSMLGADARFSTELALEAATNGGLKYRSGFLESDADIPWKVLATTEKIDIPFPFNAGFRQAHDNYQCRLIKDSLNNGKIICTVAKTDGSIFPVESTIIGILPVGHKSKYNMSIGAAAMSSATTIIGSAEALIYGDYVYVRPDEPCHMVSFTIPYEIA